MIPKPFIARWSDKAPWVSFDQVEQDLIISRKLVSIFSDAFLRENLAFRGGTALHKIYLHPAPRYSEDIDLVQINRGPIKPIMKRIDEVINFFDKPRNTKISGHGAKALYHSESEYEGLKLRVKIETNCKEHFHVLKWVDLPLSVENGWFTGEAQIKTYELNELLGTKLRALYQRKKGRDLFDLYYSRNHAGFNVEELTACFNSYMKFSTNSVPTSRQFELNMEEKEKDPIFSGDMEALLRPSIEYDEKSAFYWLKNEVISNLKSSSHDKP